MRSVLGINAFHGDASAAIVCPSGLVAAVQEERFTRVKHWAGFPRRSIGHCVAEAGGWDEVDAVAVARKPRAYFLKKVSHALRHPLSLPRAAARVRNLKAVEGLGEQLCRETGVAQERRPPLHSVEHHVAHVASAFYCSPFEEAACVSIDGFGDFVSGMVAIGRGTGIHVLDRVCYPHSLGLFYTALTQHLGFPHYGDEYKVMGLAAYGEPRFVSELERVVGVRPGGRYALDLSYFRHVREGVDMHWDDGVPRLGPVFSERLTELLGPARRPDDEIDQRHRDLAASVQTVYERALVHVVREAVRRSGAKRLCLAGGCAQNSLANGKLYEAAGVDEVFVQPAAGDEGTALGAALYVQHAVLGRPRTFVMDHAYWGPEFTPGEWRAALAAALPGSSGKDGRFGDLDVRTVADEALLAEETAKALASGEVVGWYQGRGEWGPRALGNRSILADPRRPDAREVLNVRIKRREPFRPFAPSVLADRIGDWFVGAKPDLFMTQVFPARPDRRDRIPAVVHADGTGRLQAVRRETNPRFWNVVSAFERRTGVPIVLNTSFNESEPIVNRPEEALACFLRTRMDRLVIGDVVVVRRSERGDGSETGVGLRASAT